MASSHWPGRMRSAWKPWIYRPIWNQHPALAAIKKLPLKEAHGPEDIALYADGRIYAATHEGFIVRLESSTAEPEKWVNTGVTETSQYLYIGSLITDFIARLPKSEAGL